jgi:hypothetical protein
MTERRSEMVDLGDVPDEKNLTLAGSDNTPSPGSMRYRVKLTTIGEARREIGKLYKLCRSGRMSTQEGTRLVYMLQVLGKMIESESFEQRLVALEERSS